MDTVSDRIAAIVARCRERQEDPEFQRQAARLAQDERDFAALQAEVERNHRLLRSGVPVGLWKTCAAPRQTAALDAVRAHLEAPPSAVFLTLAGPRGRGKTVAGAWAVYERGGRFLDAHDLVRLSSFDGEWDELVREPVVTVDELGAEYLNDAYRANLYALLNRRYADQRKTILITNLAPPAFVARYCPTPEDRLLDRLTTAGTWRGLEGESMRVHWQQAAEESHGD